DIAGSLANLDNIVFTVAPPHHDGATLTAGNAGGPSPDIGDPLSAAELATLGSQFAVYPYQLDTFAPGQNVSSTSLDHHPLVNGVTDLVNDLKGLIASKLLNRNLPLIGNVSSFFNFLGVDLSPLTGKTTAADVVSALNSIFAGLGTASEHSGSSSSQVQF